MNSQDEQANPHSGLERSLIDFVDGSVAGGLISGLSFDSMELTRLAREPGALFRTWFEPGHFTVSLFVLSLETRRVLLIHHTKLERWLQPGGHVEPGDRSIVDAGRRELLEETGVAVEARDCKPMGIDIHEIPAFRDEPAHLHFDCRFLAEFSGLAESVSTSESEVAWLDPLDERASSATGPLMPSLVRAFM